MSFDFVHFFGATIVSFMGHTTGQRSPPHAPERPMSFAVHQKLTNLTVRLYLQHGAARRRQRNTQPSEQSTYVSCCCDGGGE